MRRALSRLGVAIAYLAAFGLVWAGLPTVAAAVGAGVVTAATALLRPIGAWSILMGAALAAVAGAAVFAGVCYVLAPAYPAVRAFAASPTLPLAVTLLFGLLARLDYRGVVR